MVTVDSGDILRPCASAEGTLRLPWKRWRKGDDIARPTCFFLTGGPGISNLRFTPPRAWIENMDVVTLEYRGVGQSSLRLNAPSLNAAVLQPLSALSLAGAEGMRPYFAAGFQEMNEQGIVFEEFGLSALADDIEAARQELGCGKIFLIAHSFGTRIAQVVQTRYRASVAGSLLLGCNSPAHRGLIWFPGTTNSVWSRWAESDSAQEKGIGNDVAQRLLHGWDRQGYWNPGDSAALMMAFFRSFSSDAQLPLMRTLLAAEKGKSPAWFFMGRSYSAVARLMFNWADFFLKGYLVEGDRRAIELADSQGENALFASPSSVFFSGLEEFYEAGGRQDDAHSVNWSKTILVTGEFDTSTPIELLPEQVPTTHRIILPGAGHAQSLQQAKIQGVQWLQEYFGPEFMGQASLRTR
ncbi:MAG: alpha/beta hydrolase [Actinomycetaceae bacterium]|nr:alpha/beta hydrolase [Actinomycetaceae bacterium]